MKINPTVIGLFILGGLTLVIVAVLGLGGSALLERREHAVAYFRGSVQGLSVGARVEFRGVPVGKVDAIKLEIDVRDLSAVIPVFFDYDPHAWRYIGGPAGRQVNVAEAVAKGLRAELVPQSFVTGQMLVELDMLPGTPGELFHSQDEGVPEIPTVKSDIEQLKDVLTSLPLRDIATSLNKTAHSLDRLLESPELVQILKDLRTTTANTASLTGNLDADRVKLMADLHAAIAAIEKSAVGLQGVETDARQSLKTIDQVAGADLRKTLHTAELALQQLQTTFSEAATMLAPQSPDREQISRILDNALYALQSVRRLADDIQRKPNALLFGR